MELKFEAMKRTGVIRTSGRLDAASAPDVKAFVQRMVGEGWTRLIFDLGQVSFIDSSGLGALIAGLKTARQAGGDLRIAAPKEQARYILHVSTLEKVLHPYPSVDEALVD
jgi:anti-sigma B factor antagonist